MSSIPSVLWTPESGEKCPECGHTAFHQVVLATEHVSTDSGVTFDRVTSRPEVVEASCTECEHTIVADGEVVAGENSKSAKEIEEIKSKHHCLENNWEN